MSGGEPSSIKRYPVSCSRRAVLLRDTRNFIFHSEVIGHIMKQALYRKYRPADFSHVTGQNQVTVTLKNEVASGNISHAYLFTGVRGTGKTSCARILAKAVNCLSPRDGNPCNECEICRGIDNGSITDVIEIDAASNTSVDNIRALREEINYLPMSAKYKMYIIDEVHMLSSGAFNALLKTLEEPPSHAIFVLATTEVYKLPATIMSRCQRFNFRRIDAASIAAYLSDIAKAEGFSVTDDALKMLAAAADGGMRDAISLLDVCRAASDNIDASVVSRAVGLSGNEKILRLCSFIANGDISSSLELLAALYADSKEPERLCEELLGMLRNLLIVKTAKNPDALINVDPSELEGIKRTAALFSLGKVMSATAAVNDAISRMRFAYDKKTEAEMLLISLCISEDNATKTCDSASQSTQSSAEPTKAQTANPVSPKAEPKVENTDSGDLPPLPEPPPIFDEPPLSESPAELRESSFNMTDSATVTPEKASFSDGDASAVLKAALPEIRKAAPMVGATLSQVSASIEGDILTLHSGADYISSRTELIAEAIFKATGKKLKVTAKAPEPSAADILSNRLNKFFN